MRNGSLWRNIEVIFYEFDFETSDLEFEVVKSSIWKHETSCDNGVFSFIIISQCRWPIELKFSQVSYFMYTIMWIYLCWKELISVACVVILFFVIYSFTDSPICLAIYWIFVVVLLFCCFIHIQTSVYWCKSLSGKGDCLINFFVDWPIFC